MTKNNRIFFAILATIILAGFMVGCKGGGNPITPPPPVQVTYVDVDIIYHRPAATCPQCMDFFRVLIRKANPDSTGQCGTNGFEDGVPDPRASDYTIGCLEPLTKIGDNTYKTTAYKLAVGENFAHSAWANDIKMAEPGGTDCSAKNGIGIEIISLKEGVKVQASLQNICPGGNVLKFSLIN